jgi:hypothetical protein
MSVSIHLHLSCVPHRSLSLSPHPPSTALPDWIHQGLNVSVAGNRVLKGNRRPKSARQRVPTVHQSTHGSKTARVHGMNEGHNGAPGLRVRPQTSRAAVPASIHSFGSAGNAAKNPSTTVEVYVEQAKDTLNVPLTVDVSDDVIAPGTHVEFDDVGGYMGQTSAVRRRRPGEAPPPPKAPAPPEPLRDPMASLEGRWAEGIELRIRKNKDGVMPSSTHPLATDPSLGVRNSKRFMLDPSKTSAGLTQDLIKWSKFDGRYDRPRSRSRSPRHSRNLLRSPKSSHDG